MPGVLRHRLLVGVPMAVGMAGVLFADEQFAPLYPILLALVLLLGASATRELLRLLTDDERPAFWTTTGLVWCVLACNWLWRVPGQHPYASALATGAFGVLALAAAPVSGTYRTRRLRWRPLASAGFAVGYLAFLPSCLVQLRWLPAEVAVWAMAATIFVPKVGDIGAYFTGRMVGRHRMAPTISPKKTWEGFAGGMVASAGTAYVVSFAAPKLFPHGRPEAVAFGLVVGVVGVLGDLFESWLKRRAQVKDASATLPGFGGVLDVIDSVLFAAPVAYLWFTLNR